jgi:hypothetical protein
LFCAVRSSDDNQLRVVRMDIDPLALRRDFAGKMAVVVSPDHVDGRGQALECRIEIGSTRREDRPLEVDNSTQDRNRGRVLRFRTKAGGRHADVELGNQHLTGWLARADIEIDRADDFHQLPSCPPFSTNSA